MSDISSRPLPPGFTPTKHSALLRRRPPDGALAWVERVTEARVVRVQALHGGQTSAVHALRLHRAATGDAENVVLRRYVIAQLNEVQPRLAAREAEALAAVADIAVPAPRLLACDPTGGEVGVPAVLMTKLPGRLVWSPAADDLPGWLAGLARTLPPLHAAAVPLGDRVPPFAAYPPLRGAPAWVPPDLWDRAVDASRRPLSFAGGRLALIHRDYHPGNVLWRRGRVSGLVDWQAACIGPPAIDVGWCRLRVLGHLGRDAAVDFTRRWEAEAGERYDTLADLVHLVDLLGSGELHRSPPQDELVHLLANALADHAGAA